MRLWFQFLDLNACWPYGEPEPPDFVLSGKA
jgi:hypothetical protein